MIRLANLGCGADLTRVRCHVRRHGPSRQRTVGPDVRVTCRKLAVPKRNHVGRMTPAFRERTDIDSLPRARALRRVQKSSRCVLPVRDLASPQAACGSATSSARILALASSSGVANVACRRGGACSVEICQATKIAVDAAILFATISESINGVNMVLYLRPCELMISMSELRQAGFPPHAWRP